jgi:DnaJ-class molecular chaperone
MEKRTLYDYLEIGKDANHESIKKAFRKKAKQTHHDKGGNQEEFRAMIMAYNILSDEEKRKRYDQGENPDVICSNNGHEQQVRGFVLSIFNLLIDQNNFDLLHNDLFEIIRQNIRLNKQTDFTEQGKHRDNIKRYENILKRIKKTDKDKSELFTNILTDKISYSNGMVVQIGQHIKLCDDALEYLNGCEYETDSVQRMMFFQSTSTTTGW